MIKCVQQNTRTKLWHLAAYKAWKLQAPNLWVKRLGKD